MNPKEEKRKNKQRNHLSQLLDKLAKIRTFLTIKQANSTQNIQNICEKMSELEQMVQVYLKMFQQKSQVSSIFQESDQQGYFPMKINLYIWQILNFITINNYPTPSFLSKYMKSLVLIDLQYEHFQSANSLKNLLIFFHNLITKQLKQTNQLSFELKKIFCLLVTHNFQKSQQSVPKILQLNQKPKQQDVLIQQMQWHGYIFMKIFNKLHLEHKPYSIVQQLTHIAQYQHFLYYLVHSLNNYFQNMIDHRVTTQLVINHPSPLQDVRQMYSNQQKSFVSISLASKDLTFILEYYQQQMEKYFKVVRQFIQAKIDKISQKEVFMEIKAKWKNNADVLTQIGHLLNSLLFIGGYNIPLQNIVIQSLLQNNQLLLSYLQLSYLLFRNLVTTKYNSKVQILVEMEKSIKQKLLTTVKLQKIPPSQLNIKQLQIEQILAPGQLVLILRLLNNLVHINPKAQRFFQPDPKYLHMIMSLTHDSAEQTTMRQWSILFIKNVSDNQTLKQHISQVEMHVKTEQ